MRTQNAYREHFSGTGTDFLGIGIPFFGFACSTVAFSILITWVFNHSRGSVLLASRFHASSGATEGSFLVLFPLLFPQAVVPIAPEIGLVLMAVLIVVVTRGRLGYQRYLRETALPSPVTDRERGQAIAGTSV